MHVITSASPGRDASRLNEFFAQFDGENEEHGFSATTLRKFDPFFKFLFEDWFDVTVIGLENVPAQGKVVMAGNHSGVIPIDAYMLFQAMAQHHPAPRRIRFLAMEFLRTTPGLKRVINGFGGVPATEAVAMDLLSKDEIVFFYPEGPRGTGKNFSDRYRLVDFNPGFVKMAIATGAPIIPVTTIGGDEIFPLLGNNQSLARLMKLPYWPLTGSFPWLPFPANLTPLPIKFAIVIGEPVVLNYAPERASDKKLRMQVAREVQYSIQRNLNSLLRQRISPLAGWNSETLSI
jgi:1-acyl-sn-glycerol-3-phosphate acyltransferase